MKKTFKRILAAMTTLVMLAVTWVLPASAATYQPITLTDECVIHIEKEWEIPEPENAPHISFMINFLRDPFPDEGQIQPDFISKTIYVNMAEGEIDGNCIRKSVDYTISGLTFKTPGIYAYVIHEIPMFTAETPEDREAMGLYDLTYDSRTEYEIKIKIDANEETGALFVAGIWMEPAGSPGEKIDTARFHNISVLKEPEPTADLTVKNSVAGKDTSGDFTFTIDKLAGAEGEYTVTTPAGDKFITVAEDGTVTGDAVVLKNEETFVIKGLPIGTEYSITETDPGENYTVTVGGSETMNAAGELAEKGTTIEFLNTLQESVPTGILLDILPFVLLAFLIAAAAVILVKKRRD